MSICKNCDSQRLIYVRKDSDWGNGGDLMRLNDDSVYLPGDPEDIYEYDIMFNLCLACGAYDSIKEK